MFCFALSTAPLHLSLLTRAYATSSSAGLPLSHEHAYDSQRKLEITVYKVLKGSFDVISSFPLYLEHYKLFVHI